jgi:hypothetical protein
MFDNLAVDRRLDEDNPPSANTRHGWTGADEYVYTASLQDEDDRYLAITRAAPRQRMASRCRTLLEKLTHALTRQPH